ncbi:MAG TPA: sulfate ABC transporter permease subunit CysW [Candidatus Hydrogenedens sp.]|nr:sulfate ABC transporter permease subunit CysW [Candidatus Hydrogenedens sp.]HPP59128.1 sulfate ABC transporter permease subunit CysW [Candidatus Hydrogenedens sp.]
MKSRKVFIFCFRFLLTIIAFCFLLLFLVIPLFVVFYNAFSQGLFVYANNITRKETLESILLTIKILCIVLPVNTIFGIACGWYVTRYTFRGKKILLTFLDLPFTVSPVVAGTVFILLFSVNGLLGTFIERWDIQIIFAFPGMVLATLFVTFPFVARELIPIMEEQGQEMEEAGRMLGANTWQILLKITLPNIRWALFYGMVLCSARCVGEFGAVSVVSGHIRGKTITVPLEVEILYNEYNLVGAFCVASLLCIVGIISLIFRKWIEKRDPIYLYMKTHKYGD